MRLPPGRPRVLEGGRQGLERQRQGRWLTGWPLSHQRNPSPKAAGSAGSCSCPLAPTAGARPGCVAAAGLVPTDAPSTGHRDVPAPSPPPRDHQAPRAEPGRAAVPSQGLGARGLPGATRSTVTAVPPPAAAPAARARSPAVLTLASSSPHTGSSRGARGTSLLPLRLRADGDSRPCRAWRGPSDQPRHTCTQERRPGTTPGPARLTHGAQTVRGSSPAPQDEGLWDT